MKYSFGLVKDCYSNQTPASSPKWTATTSKGSSIQSLTKRTEKVVYTMAAISPTTAAAYGSK